MNPECPGMAERSRLEESGGQCSTLQSRTSWENQPLVKESQSLNAVGISQPRVECASLPERRIADDGRRQHKYCAREMAAICFNARPRELIIRRDSTPPPECPVAQKDCGGAVEAYTFGGRTVDGCGREPETERGTTEDRNLSGFQGMYCHIFTRSPR